MDDYLEGLSTEEKEMRVLDYELKSLKKDRQIYLQQPNSNIFFHCKKSDALNHLEEARERIREGKKSTPK